MLAMGLGKLLLLRYKHWINFSLQANLLPLLPTHFSASGEPTQLSPRYRTARESRGQPKRARKNLNSVFLQQTLQDSMETGTCHIGSPSNAECDRHRDEVIELLSRSDPAEITREDADKCACPWCPIKILLESMESEHASELLLCLAQGKRNPWQHG